MNLNNLWTKYQKNYQKYINTRRTEYSKYYSYKFVL